MALIDGYVDDAKELSNTLLESCILWLKDEMRGIIAQQLKVQLEKWSDPQQIKQLFADTLLPNVIVPKLVFLVANQEFATNIDKYAKFITDVVNESDPDVSKNKFNEFMTKLYKQTDGHFSSAPLHKIGKDHEGKLEEEYSQGRQFFIQTMNPLLEPVLTQLKDYQKVHGDVSCEYVKQEFEKLNQTPVRELKKILNMKIWSITFSLKCRL